MKRPVLAALVVVLGFLASATATTAPARSADIPSVRAAAAPAAIGRATVLPVATKADRCATRSKAVTRLKRRYKTAKTKRGKARALRLLNASRRSLKRCRAQKPKPNTKPGPGANPAPGTPAPAPPAPAPPPTAPPSAPPVEGVRLTVNDAPGGTFASSATFTLAATGLPELPEGQYYRLGIRSPEKGSPREWREKNCQQNGDSEPFRATGSAVTLQATERPRWCDGAGKVMVWSGGLADAYSPANPWVAALDITVLP